MVVGQAAIVEHLQQDVEHVAVSFFDFIEQHDGVGAAADRFGELAAFFVADVSRRSADEAAHGVLFHEFAHVDADHGVLVVEQDFGERLAKLGFADARGAAENERADGPVRILQAAAAAADGVGDGSDGFVLPDDALVEAFFEDEKFRALFFEHAGDGHAGPRADDFGDFIGADFLAQQAAAGRFASAVGVGGGLLRGGILQMFG